MLAKKAVISLGGSLVYTKEGINLKFLKRFRQFIIKQTNLGRRFIIVVGGGELARYFQSRGRKLVKAKNGDLDWLGIYPTRCNAYFVKTILGDLCEKEIITDPSSKINWRKKVFVGAGWKPGRSTDYVAVYLADKFGIDTVLNFSNIDYVYDKNPQKHRNAKPLKRISWKDYLKISKSKWVPGMNLPFDPIASKLAARKGIKVGVLNGGNFKNLSDFLEGKEGKDFRGTIIK